MSRQTYYGEYVMENEIHHRGIYSALWRIWVSASTNRRTHGFSGIPPISQTVYANISNAITECGLGIVSDGRTNKIHFQFALDDLLLLKSKEIV